jgi:hypothetical protein
VFFCDLLFDELAAYAMSDESHDCRKPVMRLTGSDGHQDEKHCESLHDLSPYVEWLTVSIGSS